MVVVSPLIAGAGFDVSRLSALGVGLRRTASASNLEMVSPLVSGPFLAQVTFFFWSRILSGTLLFLSRPNGPASRRLFFCFFCGVVPSIYQYTPGRDSSGYRNAFRELPSIWHVNAGGAEGVLLQDTRPRYTRLGSHWGATSPQEIFLTCFPPRDRTWVSKVALWWSNNRINVLVIFDISTSPGMEPGLSK